MLAITEREIRQGSLQKNEQDAADRERDKEDTIDVGSVNRSQLGRPPMPLSEQRR
jgi:hypothetical protein